MGSINQARTVGGRLSLLAGSIALSVVMLGCEEDKTTPEAETATAEKAAEEKAAGEKSKAAGEAEEAKQPVAGEDESDLADIAAKYKVDPAHSSVVFNTSHFGVSNVYGMFPEVTGTLNIDEDPSKSEVELEIDPASVFTAAKKRDDHLKSADFLNVKQFGKIDFKSKKIEATDEGTYEVSGDLTLHGVTKPVTITMKKIGAGDVPMDNTFRVGFEGETTIDRTEFGMEKLPEAAGKEVAMTISVEAIRQ